MLSGAADFKTCVSTTECALVANQAMPCAPTATSSNVYELINVQMGEQLAFRHGEIVGFACAPPVPQEIQ